MSFILTRICDENELIAVSDIEGWTAGVTRFGSRCIGIADPAVCLSLAEADGKFWALLGSVANHCELRQMLAMYDSRALICNHAELIVLLINKFGEVGLSLVDGAFVVFCDDVTNGVLTATTDVLGQYPLYATAGSHPWIAPSPRLAALKPAYIPDFATEAEVLQHASRADDYVPIRNMIRAKPGCSLKLREDRQGHGFVSMVPFHMLGASDDRDISLDIVIDSIDKLLVPAICNAFDWRGLACVPLSGGVDSSIVAAFGSRSGNLHTLAMGTERSNEYLPAKRVAAHIGSVHREVEISTDDILTGFFDSIYYNGIFDGYAAEVQASLFALLRDLHGKADIVVTGYGADLLMGGTLNPGCLPELGVNQDLWTQVYRTRWSSEFSPVGANSLGMQIRHPFWTPRFVGFSLDLPQRYKVSEGEVKIALRTFAERQAILPTETVWRKKIAIHHGSSVENILSDALGIAVSPRIKEKLAYSLFRDAVTGVITPGTFSPSAIRDLYKSVH